MMSQFYFTQRSLLDSLGSEYDLENEYEEQEDSEEVKQKKVQKALYWSQIAKKCKEHINLSLPSVEYEVSHGNGPLISFTQFQRN